MTKSNIITRCIFILLILIFGCRDNNVQAQTGKFTAGGILGFYGVHIQGESNQIFSPTNGTISGTGGFSLGLNIKREVSESIFAALEMRYCRKGSIYAFTTHLGSQAFETIKIDYLEIPILIGLKIQVRKKHLFAETGPVIGKLVGSKMTLNDLNKWDYSSMLDNFKHHELAWSAAVKYPLTSNEKLLLGARFTHSLLSIHQHHNLYNMNYGIEVNYLFN